MSDILGAADVSREIMEAFVQGVFEERAKLPPPQPTDKHPLPAADAFCKQCRRSFRSPNPLKKGPNSQSPFLPAKAAMSLTCVPCRNGQGWGFKSWTKADIEGQLESDDAFYGKYMFVIFKWEEQFNSEIGAMKQSAMICLVGAAPVKIAQ